MKYFDVSPSDCLIFEDSYTGVLAASRAGIEVVNIYDKYADALRNEIDSITTYKISDYKEFIDKCVAKVEKEEEHNFNL